jgi:hypothetical protein
MTHLKILWVGCSPVGFCILPQIDFIHFFDTLFSTINHSSNFVLKNPDKNSRFKIKNMYFSFLITKFLVKKKININQQKEKQNFSRLFPLLCFTSLSRSFRLDNYFQINKRIFTCATTTTRKSERLTFNLKYHTIQIFVLFECILEA